MELPTSARLTLHEGTGPVYYSFPSFDRLPFVRHGFSTRLGGVSRDPYATMNLSFTRGDDVDAVRENFDLFCRGLGLEAENVVVSAQEHHTNLYCATAADRGRGVTRERGYSDIDGLLTNEPGVVLCTQYADCVPLFFVDPVRKVVATSHAGWKGTAARIGKVTVEHMKQEYGCHPEDILAGIGPSIGPCCFEVDKPVADAFTALEESGDDAVRRRKDEKYDVDLWEINRRILLNAGITAEHITVTDLCTRCHPDVFWSHRAAGPLRGSLAGFIALVDCREEGK